MYPRVDSSLARRLETAEGMANAAFCEARRALDPGGGAEWVEIAGVRAMFDGAESPLTQTFGLGLSESFSASDLQALEEFFFSRGAPAFHEVCALASSFVLDLLSARGYSPIEASTVLVRPVLPVPEAAAADVSARAISDSEAAVWSRIAGQGWSSESPELGRFIEEFGSVVTRSGGVQCFLAEAEGRPIAAGALSIGGDVALLAGASTIPEARRRGAQRALLRARLAFAADRGSDLAMIVAQPGSGSQRNAERQGFRAVYTRAKWRLDRPGT